MMSLEGFRSSWLRMGIVAVGCSALFGVIAAAFWYEDLRYSLPTPRPPELYQPPIGTQLPIRAWLSARGLDASERPVLVHFLNPDCPCSRFNLDHLRNLQAHFGHRVFFVAAVQTNKQGQKLEAKLAELNLGIVHFTDRDGKLAAEAGVYSTPQALLLDATGRIVYRGNYNRSRYCTDPRTEFVRIALERLVESGKAPMPNFLPAYGCELPSADKRTASTTN